MDLYDSQTYALKTRVEIWTRMGVVLAEYEILSQKFHLSMWFFKYIAGIEFRWDHTIWWIVAIPVCIGIWEKNEFILSASRPIQVVL